MTNEQRADKFAQVADDDGDDGDGDGDGDDKFAHIPHQMIPSIKYEV